MFIAFLSPFAREVDISFESAVVVPPDVKTKAKAYSDMMSWNMPIFSIPIKLVSGIRKSAPRALQIMPDATKTMACLPILCECFAVFSLMSSKLFQVFLSIIQKIFQKSIYK